jgi:hypothetical protein
LEKGGQDTELEKQQQQDDDYVGKKYDAKGGSGLEEESSKENAINIKGCSYFKG